MVIVQLIPLWYPGYSVLKIPFWNTGYREGGQRVSRTVDTPSIPPPGGGSYSILLVPAKRRIPGEYSTLKIPRKYRVPWRVLDTTNTLENSAYARKCSGLEIPQKHWQLS